MSKKPSIIGTASRKGGTGKSMTAREVVSYARKHNVVPRIVDTEIPAGGLKRFFPDAHIYDLGTVQGEMQTLDSIDGLTVIDFRAGLVGPSLRSLNKNRFLDEVGAGALNLVIMHVIGPNDQSVAEIAEVAELVGAAKHIIVKNHIDGELGGWSANDRIQCKPSGNGAGDDQRTSPRRRRLRRSRSACRSL